MFRSRIISFRYQKVFFILEIFHSVPKVLCFVHKAFRTNCSFGVKRSIQSVWKSSGVFIVIIKMVNWQWSQKLTSFTENLENNSFISYISTFFCETALTYTLTLKLNYIYKTKHLGFSFKIKCKNCQSSMYLCVWGKLWVVSANCFQKNQWIINDSLLWQFTLHAY